MEPEELSADMTLVVNLRFSQRLLDMEKDAEEMPHVPELAKAAKAYRDVHYEFASRIGQKRRS